MAGRTVLQFVLLLALALILRSDTFGDPNIGGDEVFYHQVGLAMHQGAWPYVDIWDRKPFGLFALFYLITAFSSAPIAYQVVAALFAAATAHVIGLIARRWTGAAGALLAGVCYLLWLGPLQGFGGQSPVFYNLFVAGAVLLVLNALPALREGRIPRQVPLAMLLTGCAITIKTTVVAEAAFLGILSLWTLHGSGGDRKQVLFAGLVWALIGAAPTVLIGAVYWLAGHWVEYWHAMVVANLNKPADWPTARIRIVLLFITLAPINILASLGLLDHQRDGRRLVLAWIVAALLGLILVPNFYPHYALPLLVPMCVAASVFLNRKGIGVAATAIVAALSVMIAPIFQYAHTSRSRAAIEALTLSARSHLGGRPLLVYDGPPQLYQTTGQPLITPLVFPTHLSQLIEKDVSHLSTLAETRRVLAKRPGAVVMAVKVRNSPANVDTRNLVMAYVSQNCRLIEVIDVPERLRHDLIAVWGDCRRNPS